MSLFVLTSGRTIRLAGILFVTCVVLATLPVGVYAQAGCDNPANPVVAENCLPGTQDWILTDYQPEQIAGFASADALNIGNHLDFYVDSDGMPFDIYIYRTGYYGGIGARLVDSATGVSGQSQPACLADFVTGLYSCSNWNVSYGVDVTGDWVSGIYYIRLVRPDTGGENYMIFTVSDEDRPSDIVFQLATSTYEIYNPYGGKSLYNFNSYGCLTDSNDTRAVKVSFDRPYVQPEAVYGNTYLFADHAWIYWLEEQGYDVTYITSSTLHRYGLPDAENGLLKHKMILFAVHDEFWSNEMRDATTAARDAGVHLAFFTSNTGYWRIRYEADPHTGEADRVLVSYKTTEGGDEDPSGISTGTWRDPAGPNFPENELVGVMYFGDNDTVFFPVQLTAEMGKDRIYRHTDLQTMPDDTVVRLGNRLVGWEWDSVVDNGYSPEGIVKLTESPVYGGFLTDAGDYRKNQIRTGLANSTRYIAPSGAQVFAVGTNLWSWGLAEVEPSRYIQQITYNIFADMGVQPTTPAETLILDDAPETEPEAWEGRSEFYPADALPPHPVIADVTVTATGDTTATITWTTDIPARSQVAVGDSAETVREYWASDYEAVTEHELTLENLIPSTTYFYQPISLTEAGQFTLGPIASFETEAGSITTRLANAIKPPARAARCWVQQNTPLAIVGGLVIAVVGLGAAWWFVGRRLVRRSKQRA